MNKKKLLVLSTVLVFTTLVSSACSIPFISKEEKKSEEIDNTPRMNGMPGKADEKKIQELISKFYQEVYKSPIEAYKTAAIPNQVKGLLSKRTVSEGENNPEIGIHFPRYVELNGMTTIGYELVNDNGNGPVESTYIGKNSDSFLYYTKVYMKAECIPDTVFSQNYKKDLKTNVYDIVPGFEKKDEQVDFMKLKARFDVEVIKEGNEFKILRAKEASNRAGYQNRMMIVNNDSFERIPYINIKKSTEKKTYLNKEDGKVYDNEKEHITTFFNKIKEIDNERMNLLITKWNTGDGEFKSFLDVLKLNSDKDSKQIIDIKEDYKTKFAYDAFPLQNNMRKITKYNSINVTPHPGYSMKQKKYIVTIDATVEMANTAVGQLENYKYDYFITLSNDDKKLLVSGMSLNSVTLVPKPKKEEKKDTSKEETKE